jgi:hypothetical protein
MIFVEINEYFQIVVIYAPLSLSVNKGEFSVIGMEKTPSLTKTTCGSLGTQDKSVM